MSRVFTNLHDVTKQDFSLDLKMSRVFTNLRDVTKLQFLQSKNFPPKVSKRLKVFSFSTQQMIFIMSPLCGGGKLPCKPLCRGIADAEMKVPSVESPELRY